MATTMGEIRSLGVVLRTTALLVLCVAMATGRSMQLGRTADSPSEGQEQLGESTRVLEGSADIEKNETIKEEGCSTHQCRGSAWCDDSEGGLSDTGLPYSCRCPRQYVGIFCNVKREDACVGCKGPNFYCQRTNMHWSGLFCFDRKDGWRRVLGRCGRHGFGCDVGKTCVSPAELCNGVADCADKSDELFCKRIL